MRDASFRDQVSPTRRGLRYATARIAATLAMGSWVVIGVVPVIVVISAFV